ncbi:MAG: FHA domain-containing protein [Rikenellaceae bacterium]|nr:FHA domain-containing protein [Rikenellaceae bacterium]
MKRILLVLTALVAALTASAQIQFGEKGGYMTIGLESNNILYVNDAKLGTNYPSKFGSNDYLKLDYVNGRFSVGVQGEAYLPALQGYNDLRNNGFDKPKVMLASKYIQWQDANYSVMVGDVYDQFGNGLIFRSFEDRQLGINNSIEGGRVTATFGNIVSVKALFGRPRLYSSANGYSRGWIGSQYARSTVGGADLSVSLSDIIGSQELMMSIEGSYVNRRERLDRELNGMNYGTDYFPYFELTSPDLNMYSARLNLDYKGFTLRGEYAGKGKDISSGAVLGKAAKGSAVLAELGYNVGGLSVSAQVRRLEMMGTSLSLYGNLGVMGNTLNYLPALTRQHTYMLAALNPCQMNAEGELAVQADVYYTLRSKQSRQRYWNFHANYSTAYTLKSYQTASGKRELLWSDVNVDVERQWNKQWKTTVMFSRQEWNTSHGQGPALPSTTYVSNIFVGDVMYKINKKFSLRMEAQYLLSNDYEGDWVAGLVEFNVAPHWSVFFSDMYNLGTTKTNYYNGGLSFTHNRTRVQVSYGRNRAGYVCSGGVCRYQPAYTGVNLMLTTSF